MLWSSCCAVQTCPDSVPTPQDPHHPSSVFLVTPRHRSFHVMKSGYISCLLLSARRLVLTVFPGLRVVSASVKGVSHPPHPWAACRRQRTEVVGPVLVSPSTAPRAFVDVPAGDWQPEWTSMGKRKGLFGLVSAFFVYFISKTFFSSCFLFVFLTI